MLLYLHHFAVKYAANTNLKSYHRTPRPLIHERNFVHRDIVFSILACNQNLNARKHLNWGNYFDLSYLLMENCMCAFEIALSYAVMALSVRWILCMRGKIILIRFVLLLHLCRCIGMSELLYAGYLCILLYHWSFSQFNGASLLCCMPWFSRLWCVGML